MPIQAGYQRRFAPNLADLALSTTGVEGLPQYPEVMPAGEPTINTGAPAVGGTAMQPAPTNIYMPLANLAQPITQAPQYTSLFEGTPTFPIIQPAPVTGATYNITMPQVKTPDFSKLLEEQDRLRRNQQKESDRTISKQLGSRRTDLLAQAKKARDKGDTALGQSLTQSARSVGDQMRIRAGKDPLGSIDYSKKKKTGRAQELIGQGIDEKKANQLANNEEKEKRRREKNPVAKLITQLELKKDPEGYKGGPGKQEKSPWERSRDRRELAIARGEEGGRRR